MGDYVEALQREIRMSPWQGRSLDTLYFGGGTPSLLAPEDLGRILQALDQRYGLEGDAEITLEANPGTVDRQSLKALRRLGVNRLSLGVQSFDARSLILLGRGHTAE
jgi:oxygen-independent coproporphyrinogen-3 oxidase